MKTRQRCNDILHYHIYDTSNMTIIPWHGLGGVMPGYWSLDLKRWFADIGMNVSILGGCLNPLSWICSLWNHRVLRSVEVSRTQYLNILINKSIQPSFVLQYRYYRSVYSSSGETAMTKQAVSKECHPALSEISLSQCFCPRNANVSTSAME